LEALVYVVSEWAPEHGEACDCTVCVKVRAAIAKAEGRT
jgi:hypothetical protein